MAIRSMFKPVKKHKGTLYENVAMQIEALIDSNSLKVRDKLPSERELADIFGVSRTCIREAVTSLAARGMLSIEHGRGVFVKEQSDISEENVQKILKQILWTSPEDMRSLFEIRRLIEPQAAAWAAQRGSKAELKAISSYVKDLGKIDTANINVIELWDADTKFHLAIAKASHNQVLVRIMQSMLKLMAETRRSTLKVMPRPLKSVSEHRLICQAIVSHDADLAAKCMIDHLDNVEKELFSAETAE